MPAWVSCEQNTVTSLTFLCFTHAPFNVTHHIGSRCSAHVIHVSSAYCCCCLDTLRPSTLYSSPSLSSSFSFSCFHLHLAVDRFGAKPFSCASANEELCTLADNNPLTGYEPYFIDNYHISETTGIFIQESSGDNRPSNLHDWEISDYTIGRALSSPLFTQEREDAANLTQAYHSHEESLLSGQSSSVDHVRTRRPVSNEFGSLVSHVKENPSRHRK